MLTRPAALLGALLATLAAWLSQGSIALAADAGPRIAVLPLSLGATVLSLAAGASVYLLVRAGASRAPLSLLGFLVLPWLPVDIPPAFLVWDATLRWVVWMAVFWGMVRSTPVRSHIVYHVVWAAAPVRAAAFSLAIFGAAAWQVSPSLPGGDEPHYLVITQSLLFDGDLRIENNHLRGDYRSYFAGSLRPDYLRRGRNGAIYSIHAPGVSALVAPAFLIAGYQGAVAFLVVIAAIGSALTWHVTWLATRDLTAAWFGWAAVTLSATAIFHAFTVYPDGVGGVIVLTGVWALLRADRERTSGATRLTPWVLHGTLLALLPWLHTRFALLAGSLGALILLRLSRTREPASKAVAFLAVPALSCLCWIGYFVVLYGAPDPSAPYGGSQQFSLGFVPGGLTGLLFDQRFGLIANAPALFCALVGLAAMIAGRAGGADPVDASSTRRLGLELLFVVVPYVLTVASVAMWWGGWSAPARFAAPILPALAIPCAAAWNAMRARASRLWASGALGATVFISALLVLVDDGRLAYNTREGYALWLDRVSRLADLGQGAPAWFRGQDQRFLIDTAVWLGAMTLAWAGLGAIDGRWRPRSPVLSTLGVFLCASASMLALSAVWSLHGAEGLRVPAAQLAVLRRLAEEPRAILATLTPIRRVMLDEMLARMRIASDPRAALPGGAGRGDRPLAVLPAVPAGRYRVEVNGKGDGWIMIGIGQDQFSLRTERLASVTRPIEVDFPVDVRALIVRGDEDARRSITSVVVHPLRLAGALRLARDYARKAVRYASATLFFLDDRSFPEPDAFWLGGGRRSSIVFQVDDRRSHAGLFLRNAPVDNQLTIAVGGWREQLRLAPGEERSLQIPIDTARGASLVTFDVAAGFRPSDVEADSRDTRYLGVWVRVE